MKYFSGQIIFYINTKPLANCDGSVDFKVFENIQQIKEIRAIKWLKYEDVIKHIREYNEERLNLFKNIHKTIISLINKDGEFAKNG